MPILHFLRRAWRRLFRRPRPDILGIRRGSVGPQPVLWIIQRPGRAWSILLTRGEHRCDDN